MLAALFLSGSNITVTLTKRVVHLVDDALKVSLLVIPVPERQRRELVEEVARERDQTDRPATQFHICGAEHILCPTTQARALFLGAIVF